MLMGCPICVLRLVMMWVRVASTLLLLVLSRCGASLCGRRRRRRRRRGRERGPASSKLARATAAHAAANAFHSPSAGAAATKRSRGLSWGGAVHDLAKRRVQILEETKLLEDSVELVEQALFVEAVSLQVGSKVWGVQVVDEVANGVVHLGLHVTGARASHRLALVKVGRVFLQLRVALQKAHEQVLDGPHVHLLH